MTVNSAISYAVHRNEVVRTVRRFERGRAGLIGEICSAPADPALLTGVLAFTPFLWAPPLLEFAFTDKVLATWAQRSASRLAELDLRKPLNSVDGVQVVMAEHTLKHVRVRFQKGQWKPAVDEAGSAGLIVGAIAAAGTVTPTGLLITAAPAAPSPALVTALNSVDIPHNRIPAKDCEAVEIPAESAILALKLLGLSSSVRALTNIWRPLQASELAAEAGEMLRRGAYARRKTSVQTTHAPWLEATRIAALGPLTKYALSPELRDAAGQLVTDRGRSYDQCAAALKIPLPMFRRRLDRFWLAVMEKPEKTRAGIKVAPRASA